MKSGYEYAAAPSPLVDDLGQQPPFPRARDLPYLPNWSNHHHQRQKFRTPFNFTQTRTQLTTKTKSSTANMVRPIQDGLEWKQTLFDLVPQWTREPSIPAIESVCRQQLNIPPEDPCTVTFHASGLFNKLYIVGSQATTRPLIMRISLPVYPHHKTRGEVSTLRWVHENTTAIPVPKVFGFDDSNDNEIGFEWILMEFMEGKSAHCQWWTMSMEQKVALTHQIATFQAELARLGDPERMFRGIGTLHIEEKDASEKVTPGLLTSHEFFMGDHLHYDIPRGPFRSTYDWQCAILNIIILHQTAVLQKTDPENSDDEDDREDAEEIISVARKLLSLLPKIFPPPSDQDQPDPTAPYHHDLHLNNILVNAEGQITAIIDWECVSTMPIWMLTMVPKFLDEPVREEEPQKEMYADATADESAEKGGDGYPESEGGAKNKLYYDHQMEYEATQLRKVYQSRLSELCPGWAVDSDKHHAEMDLFKAISQCDGVWVKKVGRWADAMERGETTRFDDA